MRDRSSTVRLLGRASSFALSLAVILVAPAAFSATAQIVGFPACSQTAPGMAQVDCTFSPLGPTIIGQAEARESVGSLGTFARLAASPGDGNDYTARAVASFSDTITLISSDLTAGELYSAAFRLDLDSTLTRILPPGLGNGQLFTRIDRVIRINGVEVGPGSGADPNSDYYYFNATFGNPVGLSVSIESLVMSFDSPVAYEGIADALNTLVVSGLEIDGLAESQFTAVSAAGGSYGNIVPEPSTGLLLALGLAGLAHRRGRSADTSKFRDWASHGFDGRTRAPCKNRPIR